MCGRTGHARACVYQQGAFGGRTGAAHGTDAAVHQQTEELGAVPREEVEFPGDFEGGDGRCVNHRQATHQIHNTPTINKLTYHELLRIFEASPRRDNMSNSKSCLYGNNGKSNQGKGSGS